MRKVSLCLVVLLLVAEGSAGSRQGSYEPTEEFPPCMKWLQDRMKEAMSIKEGMSLEELLKVYEHAGGLRTISFAERIEPSGDVDAETLSQRFDEGFFDLKSCPYIKVDIIFEIPKDVDPITASREDVMIKKMSRIYLDYLTVD